MLKIYRASAGSGKTFQLTKDYIQLIFDPKKNRLHRRILAVTFTNKATDEMKMRILKELHILANGADSDYKEDLMRKFSMSEDEVQAKAKKVLIDILHDYSSFSISTIDGFFQQVIRSFAREIGVNGGYNLELNSEQVLEQAVDNLFFDLSKEENKQLLEWMSNFAEERIEQSEHWNMRKDVLELGAEIFKEAFQYKAEETNKKMHQTGFLADYREKLHKVRKEFENNLQEKTRKALKMIEDAGLRHQDFSYSATKYLDTILQGDYKWNSRLEKLTEDISFCYTKKSPQAIKSKIEDIYSNGFQDLLLKIKHSIDVEIVMYNSSKIILKRLNTLGILSDLSVQIKKLTQDQNTMLISDSNQLLNKIIDESEAPFIYEKTGIYVDHYMIDEFQDTSVLQWKNFKPLIKNSLALNQYNLLVGDLKQSIYRWRNSDWKLLDEKVLQDFKHEKIKEENLEVNWRSDKNIVEFNNSFFHNASLMLQAELNNKIDDASGSSPNLEKLRRKISHAYENVYQETSPKAGEGYVKVNFIEKDENDDGWKAEVLERLPKLLEDIQDRGYKPSDVGILVRTKDEAQEVIHKVLHYKTGSDAKLNYCYDIMGNQGLLIASAASVRFIINALELFIHPEDSIKQTIVKYEYLRGKLHLSENEALARCFSSEGMQLFSEDEKNSLEELKHLPLFEMTKSIITLFGIENWYNEIAFVQAFQDIVFRFSVGKTADLNSFLVWWNKHGAQQQIAAPDNQQAFQIMTIHKSKGLDFKVVLVPFCNWSISNERNQNILWLEPREKPFSELPLVPLNYSSLMKKSIFAEEYFDEMMHQYIDNLNVAYVAFTRARNELICFSPLPKQNSKGDIPINSIASLLYLNFLMSKQSDHTPTYIELDKYYNDASKSFELGSQSKFIYKEKKEEIIQLKIKTYPSSDASDKLRIRHQSLDYWLENQELKDSNLNYGLIMHDVLKNINYKSEQGAAVKSMIFEGRISEKEGEKIEKELEKFWEIPETEIWFDEGNKVLNEITILTPSGMQYRPDRIIIRDKKAIVVDYKFGKKESERYIKQVQKYMDLIRDIGYQVEGYICYVSNQKVQKV